jgi:hypothetical protein
MHTLLELSSPEFNRLLVFFIVVFVLVCSLYLGMPPIPRSTTESECLSEYRKLKVGIDNCEKVERLSDHVREVRLFRKNREFRDVHDMSWYASDLHAAISTKRYELENKAIRKVFSTV